MCHSKPLIIENKMRKLFTLFALCVIAFGFICCNDDDETEVIEPQETTRYRLEAWSGDEITEIPTNIEGILIFGKEKYVSVDSYFSSEANLELGLFDGVVISPWRKIKGIGYMEVLFRIKDKYYIVSHYVQKNTDNSIRLNQSTEITKQTYEECKKFYEEHAY